MLDFIYISIVEWMLSKSKKEILGQCHSIQLRGIRQ